jgi:hypothetical protein
MPNLVRISNAPKPGCIFCRVMLGARFVEGEEPKPYPYSNYGIPAHNHCTCQYIRWNLFLTEDDGELLTEIGQHLAGLLLEESQCHLITEDEWGIAESSELVPVEWPEDVPDLPPDLRDTKPGRVKRGLRVSKRHYWMLPKYKLTGSKGLTPNTY